MNEPTTAENTAAVGGSRLERLVMRRRQREYFEAIKPFTDAKVEIYAVTTPTVVIHPGGHVEHRYNFTPDQQEAIRLADEAIDAAKARIFGA